MPSMKIRRPSRKLAMCFVPSFTMGFLVASSYPKPQTICRAMGG